MAKKIKKKRSGTVKAFTTKQGLRGLSKVKKSKGKTETELTLNYRAKGSKKVKRVVIKKTYFK